MIASLLSVKDFDISLRLSEWKVPFGILCGAAMNS